MAQPVITISTRKYATVYGHNPKNTRQLSRWAFQFGQDETPWFVSATTYSNAVTQAKAEARERKVTAITVLP